MQKEIYKEIVEGREPLTGKTFGVELNLAYFMLSLASSSIALSGGVSLFDVDRRAEIVFPFTIEKSFDEDFSEYLRWNQDVVYRRFLGAHQNGLYLSGGVRYTHLTGREDTHYWYSHAEEEAEVINIDKLGVLFGIGYRYFSPSSNLYWGASLSVGSYITDDERSVDGYSFMGEKLIIDSELLKFGLTF